MNSQTSYFQDVIETVERLTPDDQMQLVEIICRRLLEQRRVEIARNADITLNAVREKKALFGSSEDLRRDLSGKR